MTAPVSVEMDETEREAFLDIGGTGVISFPTGPDEPPHSIPVSYGYDAESGAFYFRLAHGADTAKPGITEGTPVSFVTYGRGERDGTAVDSDDRWQSVVARGRLERFDDRQVDATVVAGLERVHIPLVDVFGTDPGRVTFRFFRLVPDELTGRRATSTAE